MRDGALPALLPHLLPAACCRPATPPWGHSNRTRPFTCSGAKHAAGPARSSHCPQGNAQRAGRPLSEAKTRSITSTVSFNRARTERMNVKHSVGEVKHSSTTLEVETCPAFQPAPTVCWPSVYHHLDDHSVRGPGGGRRPERPLLLLRDSFRPAVKV